MDDKENRGLPDWAEEFLAKQVEEKGEAPVTDSLREEPVEEVSEKTEAAYQSVLASLEPEEEEPEAPSALDQLAADAADWVDRKMAELPPEERAAAEEKLLDVTDTLVDTLDKAYQVSEKACDSIIDALDDLENWLNKF